MLQQRLGHSSPEQEQNQERTRTKQGQNQNRTRTDQEQNKNQNSKIIYASRINIKLITIIETIIDSIFN